MNSRPPPPQGAPPSYAFVTRVYRRSLRPVVMITCILAAFWSLIWGVASLRDISVDKDQVPKFVPFDIVLGVLYLAICAVQVLGVVAAQTRRVPLVRLFTFAQVAAAVIVFVSAIIRVVLHFAFKNDLIDECARLATGDRVITRFGFWGPTETTILDGDSARSFCSRAWSRGSFSEIIWLIIASILAFLFASIAFSYYRQLLDPSSPANTDRRPNPANGPPPSHYNPPYAGGYGGYGGGQYGNYGGYGGYGQQGPYGPPQGPPPMPAYDGAKLPEYEGNGVDGPEKNSDPFADDNGREGRGEGRSDRL